MPDLGYEQKFKESLKPYKSQESRKQRLMESYPNPLLERVINSLVDYYGEPKNVVNTLLDFIPGVGDVKSAQEAITGESLINKEKLNWWERGLSGIGALPLIPSIVGFTKGSKIGKLESVIKKSSKEPWEMTREEFNNSYAFHATKESNLPSIIEKGVTKGSWSIESVRGFPGDKLLIVPQSELTARGATPSRFGPWNLLEPEGTRSRKYTNPIPADKITIIDKTDNPHETLIKQALSEGKPVPPEVLKDYPKLEELYLKKK